MARAQKMGRLVREARQASGKSIEACAALLGCQPEEYAELESGSTPLSLPELELLAYTLDVPLARFWQEDSLEGQARSTPDDPAELALLRQRIIGAQVRAARSAAGLSQGELAEAAGLAPDELPAYELGEAPIPIATLEALAAALKLPLEHFMVQAGPVAEWDSRRGAFERFSRLPPELREFVLDPMNEGYLRLAMQLSSLSVERLRGIAEGILDITY